MKYLLLISVLTLVSGQEWGTQVSPCTFRSAPLPTVVQVEDCSAPPCNAIIGQNMDADILFRVPHDVKTLKTRAIFLVMNFIPMVVDLGHAGDTCSSLLSGRCPADQGSLLLHRLSLFIDNYFPVGVTMPFEISVEDENNAPVACFRTTISVLQG